MQNNKTFNKKNMNNNKLINKWSTILKINKLDNDSQVKVATYAEMVFTNKTKNNTYNDDVFNFSINVLKKLPLRKIKINNVDNCDLIETVITIPNNFNDDLTHSNTYPYLYSVEDILIGKLRILFASFEMVEIYDLCSNIIYTPNDDNVDITIFSYINMYNKKEVKINKKLKVFISSPYTLGNKEVNVKNSLFVANTLMDMNITPFAPLLTHYQNELFLRDEEDWLAWDIEWMLTCDVVLRLPGLSQGADNEVKIAIQNRMPVLYSIDELKEYIDLIKFNNTQNN